MKKLSIAIFLGAIAGVIDVIPMIIQKLDWYSNISAFCFWTVMGIILSYTAINMKSWLKGMIISVVSAVPVMILVWPNDPKGVMAMLIMAVILGSLLGILTNKYAIQDVA